MTAKEAGNKSSSACPTKDRTWEINII